MFGTHLSAARIEFLVLKAVAFHFDVLMPLEYLDQQTDRALDRCRTDAQMKPLKHPLDIWVLFLEQN